jgi:DNA-binding MarR family transcriptional regulator
MSDETLEALQLRQALAELHDQAHRRTPAAVAELRRAGLTVRDAAQLLGVTPSRVSQIEKRTSLANFAQRSLSLPALRRAASQCGPWSPQDRRGCAQ